MTAARDASTDRTLGRIEGAMDAVAASLMEIKSDGAARDAKLDDMTARLTEVERVLRGMASLPSSVTELQQFFRDGRMMTKGAMFGLMAAGAVLGTAGAKVLAAIYAAFSGS